MKPNQAAKSRAKAAGRKSKPSAPLTRLMVLDALRTWVIPAVAGATASVIFVIYNIDLVGQTVAVTTVGALAILAILFFGLRSFMWEAVGGILIAILVGFALVWGFATFYPFYRAVNPGTPVFATKLTRSQTVTVPLHGRAGRYSVVVEGRFVPAQGHVNRTAKYSIGLGHNGTVDRVLEGTFNQEWGSQRIGAGRRSSLVPVMRQTTQVLEAIDDNDGRDLTLKLTDLSPDVGDAVEVRFYTERVPQPVMILIAVLALAGAVVIDSWRPRGTSDGLMTTLTIATLLSVIVFRASAVATPGFPQLVIAALAGTLAGAIGGSLIWRLSQPVRKYLPARP
jgi:hypothetical protein